MKRIALSVVTLLSLANTIPALSSKKNLIIDTDLFSDVDDAGALLLAATLPEVNLLAVNINYPSSYSALAASAILAHYGKQHVPIGIPRPLTNATFFDGWYFELGEYTSKVAYQFSGGSLPWGHAEEAWDPVALYRKTLAEAEDGSVTIVSIGFLDSLSLLLDSPPDTYSHLPGRALLALKLTELVVMGGGYPSGHSWNFFGSDPRHAAHVINTWDGPGRVVSLGDDVGKYVLTGGPLMAARGGGCGCGCGPEGGGPPDPVAEAYMWYGYGTPRPSWDVLAVWYAVYGLGGLLRVGNEGGWNVVDGEDGSNRWVGEGEKVGDEGGRKNGTQFYLRLAVGNETAAEVVDDLFLKGALSVGEEGEERGNGEFRGGKWCRECEHEEL
ncbi:inosine-uridine preferring nucleoside hydrolase-domain-containing protein [Dichotomopilus funicola]|uniref:Inosine-uridine preferring nucleoside hydrolase-domain-containing protein n=1 Tax=Dichotomopilus funicola TaxID=1934379 RepID=A0AAN6ZI91_9PEZI|nr:inosine-uridine preferring nucleoside hydrolase-domain-containing protein [Dichotomopilus funicola]